MLKEFLRLDYRGFAEHLMDHPDVAGQIGLKTVPHFTTFQKAARRLLLAAPARKLFDSVLERALRDGVRKRRVPLAAVDGTGWESRHTSRSYVKRRSRSGDRDPITTYAKFPKVVFVVDCTSHMILAAVPGRGPGSDLVQFDAAWTSRPPRSDRDPSGRRGLRRRVGPPRRPVAWDWLPHPADWRATDAQATDGLLAAADEAAIRSVQTEVWAALAGRDGQLDGQAAIGLRAACAEVPEPMPRDHAESHNT